MAKETNIQWCDSTGNIQMGCEGCELRKGDHKSCYAGRLTDRYAGLKGWPNSFEEPKVFIDRLPKIISWSDLTGKDRDIKPWLNGMPRIVFLNDMGDTFSNGLPEDWFAKALLAISKSAHQFLVLTKWPKRFMKFSLRYDLPKNIWPGTSITSDKTTFRAWELDGVIGGRPKWISLEPMWGCIQFSSLPKSIQWIVFGGESGMIAKSCDINWFRRGLKYCIEHNIAAFVKQLGARPFEATAETNVRPIKLKDSHGGDMSEWYDWLRIRQMPKLSSLC